MPRGWMILGGGLMLVLAGMVGGCSVPATTARPLSHARKSGPSAERRYAESLIVPGSRLGGGLIEVDRAIVARTRYGYTDTVASALGPDGIFPANYGELLKREMRIVSGVVYARPGEEAHPVAARVVYLISHYRPLALPAGFVARVGSRGLPPFVDRWEQGADGIALGVGQINDLLYEGQPMADGCDRMGLCGQEVYYLLADGMMVQIQTDRVLAGETARAIVTQVRAHLAPMLAREKRLMDEQYAEMGKDRVAIRMGEYMHPGVEAFWTVVGRGFYGTWVKRQF